MFNCKPDVFLHFTFEPSNTFQPSIGKKENLSFEVAATDAQTGDSLIKKFPPKKFQKLEEQQNSEPVTQELLEEKQAIAEKRRREVGRMTIFNFVNCKCKIAH